MPDIGKAYVQIVPSAEGISGSIADVLDPEAKKAGTQAGKSISGNLGKGLQSAGKKMTALATVPIVGAFTGAIKTAADFDAAMSQVAAVSGATGEDFESLRDVAKKMGATTKFSASEAAEGLNYMAMAGWKTDQMVSGLPGIMNLAAASGEDLGTTSDIVTDALTAFGMSAEESGHFADVLATASSNANTNVSMLGESFKYVAPVAGSLGYSAEDVSVALGLMANAGIKASQGGTALRTMLTNMAKPTDQMAEAMDILGVSLQDGEGNMLSLREVMENLRSGFGELKIPADEAQAAFAELDEQLAAGEITEAEYASAAEDLASRAFGAEGALKAQAAAALAGKTGMSGLLAIVNASDEDFNSLTSAIDNCDGSAENMAAIMQDNLSGQMTQLKSKVEGLAIEIGEKLAPHISKVVDFISNLIDKFENLSPETQNLIMKIAGVVAVVGPALLIGGKIVDSITKITGGIGGLVGKLGGLGGAASSATPSLSSVGASLGTAAAGALKMLAAAAALYIAAQAISTLADAAIRISSAGTPAIAVLAGMGVGIAALMAVAAALGPALTAGAVGIGVFGAAMLGIGAGIDLACTGISKVIDAVGRLVEVISSNADGITAIVESIGSTVDSTITTISDGIAKIIDTISGGLSDVLDSVAGVFESIGEAALNAGSGFEKLANAVIKLTNETSALDLGATLAETAAGVTKITGAASDAGSAAIKISIMSRELKKVGTSGKSAGSSMTSFSSEIKKGMDSASKSIKGANLAASMRTLMTKVISQAKESIRTLQGAFSSTQFSFNQHIALPHFSLSGKFDAKTGAVPTTSVRWYAMASKYGAIFDSPQIIGVGDSADRELLLGENKLRELLGNGGTTNNVYVTVNGAENPEDWADRLVRQMQLRMRTA